MKRAIIFDLSEVLIAGLLGVETALSARLSAPPEQIRAALSGEWLHDLFCARLTEDEYLTRILQHEGWCISAGELKLRIRENFQQRVIGMDRILDRLASQYELVLLSDHAREWVEHIRIIHPFLQVFKAQFFSFELQRTKREPDTFREVLRLIGRDVHDCLFIDDSAANIAVAASIGLEGIRFKTAAQLSISLFHRML